MRSIRTQLNVGLVLSLLVLFFVQWLLVSASIRYLAEQYVASRLEHDAEGLLAALRTDATGVLQLDSGRIEPIYQQPFSGHYYRIVAGTQVLRSRSLWDQDLMQEMPVPGAVALAHGAGPQHQHLLIRNAGYRRLDRRVSIAVAEDLGPIDTGLRGFQWRYALVSLGALLLLLLVQQRVVRIVLLPLEHVRRDLRRLESGELQALDTDTPDEIRPLVAQINRLLDALSQRLNRSRHALGNLAHALKTPLTLLNQLTAHAALNTHPELRAQLQAQLDTLHAITERELKRARLAGAARVGARVALAPELSALVDTLQRIYRDKRLAFDVRVAEDAVCAIDREDLLELVGNLLDNACKWARHQVRVTVETTGRLSLRIEDDGPGCDRQQLDQLTERGTRVDEHTAGHGLGLAIVQEIVEQYGGTLRFGRSEELGGFLVEVVIGAESDSVCQALPDRQTPAIS